MNSSRPTPAAARAALDEAASTSIDSPRDRWVIAVANATLGLILGVYVAVSQGASGQDHYVIAAGLFVLAILGIDTWQKRSIGTMPRGVRTLIRWGGIATVAVTLAAIITLNAMGESHPAPWPAKIAAAVIIALPLLVTGHLIRRGRA